VEPPPLSNHASDNGSDHRGTAPIKRCTSGWQNDSSACPSEQCRLTDELTTISSLVINGDCNPGLDETVDGLANVPGGCRATMRAHLAAWSSPSTGR
jgi:hypothetical protein